MYSLNGKVVIVTGASEGIGAHLAAVLQKRGALSSPATKPGWLPWPRRTI
jgi:hypothetical protein